MRVCVCYFWIAWKEITLCVCECSHSNLVFFCSQIILVFFLFEKRESKCGTVCLQNTSNFKSANPFIKQSFQLKRMPCFKTMSRKWRIWVFSMQILFVISSILIRWNNWHMKLVLSHFQWFPNGIHSDLWREARTLYGISLRYFDHNFFLVVLQKRSFFFFFSMLTRTVR